VATNLDPQTRLANLALAGVPADATPFRSVTPVVNTGAAVVAIKAAVTAKRHWITQWETTNITAGEYPVCELMEDEASAALVLAVQAHNNGHAAGKGTVVTVFNPPIPIASGKSIGFKLQTATGDVHSSVSGFVES